MKLKKIATLRNYLRSQRGKESNTDYDDPTQKEGMMLTGYTTVH